VKLLHGTFYELFIFLYICRTVCVAICVKSFTVTTSLMHTSGLLGVS